MILIIILLLSFNYLLDGEEIVNEDDEAMMKMMGFANFDSTKVRQHTSYHYQWFSFVQDWYISVSFVKLFRVSMCPVHVTWALLV